MVFQSKGEDLRPLGVTGRTKDDLHEWSIYRQNVTCSIADGLFQIPGAIPPNADSAQGLTYPDFRMHETARESVVNQGRLEENRLTENPDNYLMFGLPRVAMHANGGHHPTLQRSDTFTRGHAKKRTHSEWDIRFGVSPYNSPMYRSDRPRRTLTTSTAIDDIDVLGDDSPVHYAESEITAPRHEEAAYSNGFLQSSRHHAQYFSNVDLFRQPSGFNYLRYAKAEELGKEEKTKPHLRITKLGYNYDVRTTFDRMMLRAPVHLRALDDVTFELFGGETLALMYTTELEMRALLRVLSGQGVPRGRIDGQFEINGRRLRPSQFGARVAHVAFDDPFPWFTVRQHMELTAKFRRPATDNVNVQSMIDQLIQTLALTPYRNRLIEDLRKSEKQRLKIAAQILLDTDILICDNVTAEMDLYDAAFVIDYLRDWAMKLNRIVIMAVAPSTAEILAMFHKCAILASGRFIYFGASQQMTDYFESISYPCPMFKNPCDYYVDLVTHDHLSPEASAESQERIKHLSEIWNRRAPTSGIVAQDSVSPRIREPNCFSTALTIYRRFWMLLCNRPWQFLREPLYALLISILLGAIFFELPTNHRAGINDRLGLIYAVLTPCLFPNLLVNIERVCWERLLAYNDITLNYYSPMLYLTMKFIFDLPMAVLTYAAYAIPVYLLAGFQLSQSQWPSLVVFVVIVLIYSCLWRYTSWCVAYAFESQMVAITIVGSLFGLAALGSSILVNRNDQLAAVRFLHPANPPQWAARILAANEFLGTSPWHRSLNRFNNEERNSNGTATSTTLNQLVFDCERKRVLSTRIKDVPIFTVSPCAKITGQQALAISGLSLSVDPSINSSSTFHFYFGILEMIAWITIAVGLALCAVNCNHRPKYRIRRND